MAQQTINIGIAPNTNTGDPIREAFTKVNNNFTELYTFNLGQTAGSTIQGFVNYSATTKTAGQFYGGTAAPDSTTRLNFDGYFYATRLYGDGTGLTSLPAGNLTGTIPSAVLGNSSLNIGTTSIALNRSSGVQSLTGVSIDGNAGTVTNGVYTTGAYADPTWITSLDKAKVGLGNVENTALSTWAGSTNITTIGAATATSLSVTGNLTVNGTTTTVNSTTVTIDDPILTLGGDTAPTTDDNKDRGIEFRWHNGTTGKLGFFGFDDSTGKFTFIPDATNTSEVFSGTKGTIDANLEWADVLNKPDPVVTVTLTGDVTGTANATLTDLGNGTISIATTVAADSVALGTDTTGNYVASVATTAPLSGGAVGSEGAGLTLSLASGYGDTQNPFASKTANTFLAAPNGSAGAPTFRSIVAADIPTLNQNTTGNAANVTGTVAVANGGTGATTNTAARTNLGATTLGANLFTITNPSAVTFPRFNADNTVSALDAATFRTAIGAGTSSTVGTVTSVGGTGTVSGLTLTGTVTSSGNLTLGGTLAVTASNFASQTANTFLAAPNGAAGVPTFRAIAAADIPTLNQNTTGNAATTSQRSFSGDITAGGQGRFTGWYTGNAATAIAAEIGMSGGQGYIFVYNRDNSTYGTLNISASATTMQFSGGTINVSSGALQQGGNQVLHAGNYNSYSPTLTGGNASGSWAISVTGNAATAGGLSVHSGRNNQANQIVRTDGSGYIQAGWINTDSGDSGVANRLTRIYSSYDAYLRYSTLEDFKVHMGLPYKNNYSRRIDYTTDSNYWVGSLGGSGHGANETFHGGSAFFDIWSGTNYPSGLTHIHGFNALHYTVNSFGSTGGNAYGIQVAGQYNYNGELWSRGCNGGTFSAWRKQLDSSNYTDYAVSVTYNSSLNSDSRNSRGVTRLYRRDSDSDYSVQTYWTGSYWRLYGYNGDTGHADTYVGYADSAGSAGSVAWTNVSGRPTAVSSFSNDSGYITSGGRAYPRRSDGGDLNFYWSGQSGQPTWLWGGSDGVNMYVYNPSNFSVSSAARATRANGNFYIDDNYGNGVVGVYASTRYQGVFAMGDSYKLPADGTSAGNLYGIAWSYPSAGGVAGNLDSHGMLVLINGGYGSSMSYSIKASGNVTAYSDERLKTNWRSMPESYVSKLAGVKVGIYDRIDGEKITQVGVSAQSMQQVLPEAIIVANDVINTLSINYGGAALASAVELAKDNMELRSRIERLETLVEKLLTKE